MEQTKNSKNGSTCVTWTSRASGPKELSFSYSLNPSPRSSSRPILQSVLLILKMSKVNQQKILELGWRRLVFHWFAQLFISYWRWLVCTLMRRLPTHSSLIILLHAIMQDRAGFHKNKIWLTMTNLESQKLLSLIIKRRTYAKLDFLFSSTLLTSTWLH